MTLQRYVTLSQPPAGREVCHGVDYKTVANIAHAGLTYTILRVYMLDSYQSLTFWPHVHDDIDVAFRWFVLEAHRLLDP